MAKSNKTFPNINKLSKLALAIVCANSSMIIAGPTGGSVSDGSATISGVGTDITTINQSSASVTIDWATFNVELGQEVIFNQAASDIAVNNIHDASASTIMGNITAGGTVFLSNSNGFVFGANSSVNTGSFLATTSNITELTTDADGNSSFTLVDGSSDNASIDIHKDASINANQQATGGYLAFISNKIETDSSDNDTPNVNSGLHAENGEILFSNDTSSTIKLAGLNINFPGSTFSGGSAVDLDLTGADISAKTVILTSENLADILNSVVKQPSSINSENLITSSSNIGDSISESTVEALQTSGFESLTLDYRGGNDFQLNTTINTTANRNLIINADSILLDNGHGNILGSELDLTLNADSVTIGNFSQEFGGPIGLGSIAINTASSTILQGNVHALGDISITGDTSVARDEGGTVTTKIRSENGSFNLEGTLSYNGTNNTTGNLYIRATGDSGITLGETSGFNFMDLNAQKLILNGDITATDTISLNNVSEAHANIHINTDAITLTAKTVEFEDFYFTAKNNTNILTLDALSSSSDFSVKLKNSSLYTGTDFNLLNNLIIQNNNSGKDTKIILSGEFNTSIFSTASSDSDNQFNIDLAGDTSFFNIETLDLSQTKLTGDYIFTAEAASNSSSHAQLGSIENLNGAQLSNFDKITLHDDISTKEGGLALEANDLILARNSASEPTITISNNSSGNITLDGDISSIDPDNLNSLNITTKNSNLSIGTVNNLANLSINKNLKDEGSTQLKGNITVSNDITFTNLGHVSMNQDTTLTSTTINLTDSSLSAIDSDITLDANTITADAIAADNIYINTDTLNLNGDLTSAGDLDFTAKNTDNRVSLILEDDLTLTGNINFLATATPQVTITGDKNLSLVSHNEEIYLATFDDATELNSLSIETSGINNDTSTVHFATDDKGLIILPTLNGIQGLSLLGNMSLNVGADQTFDTSSYNGNLDFSGVSINGSGSLTFNTGTGELSLGSIGINPTNEADIFTALNILSTGKLNLHGELNIFSEAYDFSHLNAIQLYTDLTLGSNEVPVNVDFGDATINGTFDLTLYSNELTLGVIGNNIALQNLTIFSESDLSLNNDITTAGSVNITSTSTSLALDNTITATGLDVNITTENDLIMSKDSEISAKYGDISLTSNMGNIGLGKLIANESVTVRSELGYLFNNIGDYISNDSTSINIQSNNQYLYGLTNIGESVSSPIVIDVQNNGTITAESGGTIFIANLANANVATTGRLLDASSGGETASIDALTQFKLSALNTINLPEISSNLNLISNLTWQVDDEESIRRIKTPTSSPSIYYSRGGWRLGQK